MNGRTTNEERYSPLAQITRETVHELGLQWYYEFDTDRGQEATPIMVDGRIFVSTAWSKVFALDARTGALLWSFDPKVSGQTAVISCCDVVNRGVAVLGDRVFVGTLDGRLIALAADNGKPLWSVMTVDPSKSYTITGAPRVVKGKVIIGNAGAELGVRGYVSAYDANDGKLVWRFYTVPGDPAKGPDRAASDSEMPRIARTWFGTRWIETGGGGTVWDSIVYDAELNHLYIGVGNGTPYDYQVRSQGKGDNLFLSSIVALDPDTGRYLWHYQEIPGEAWDYDATQNMILTSLEVRGKVRKVLLQAPKNGLFYVLDRRDGRVISARPYSKLALTWFGGLNPGTGRPRIKPGAYYHARPATDSPGPTGVHTWHPMAYNPATQLVYIPIQPSDSFTYTASERFRFKPGGFNTGTDLRAVVLPDDPNVVKTIARSLTGELVAWDPVAGKVRWSVEQPYQRNGGVLTTAGDLVFQGTADGRFVAYDARSGARLWEFAAGNGIVAAPISYAIDSQQYVAVLAGFGGSTVTTGFQFPQRLGLPGRLLVFKLGGKADLPGYDQAERPPLQIERIEADPATLERGRDAFNMNCMMCHGVAAIGGTLPDLRRSPAILDENAFATIVLGGALTQNGMVSFKDRLKSADTEAVRLYLLSRARQVLN